MATPQPFLPEASRHFSPFPKDYDRLNCRTCAHGRDRDGLHLWCERHRVVVVMACGCWEREPGTD